MAVFWYEEWHVRPKKPDPWGDFLKGAGVVFLIMIALAVVGALVGNNSGGAGAPPAGQHAPAANDHR